jgi:Ca-activated chloride channel family protein
MAPCPWNAGHRIVHIGLKSKPIAAAHLPPANLTFLIDVSGSMMPPNKLPLLKKSFGLLVDQLRPRDRVAIVVYAGAAGLVLPSTSGAEKEKIHEALDRLAAGGSTSGAAGIQLAYQTARAQFNPEGNNRVILATDGDFNVGASSDGELQRLIERERQHGIFLTVLGYGMGNVKDGKMEMLARHGNGNYAYIDNILEARRVLVEQLGATLLTVAKDVKLQVEFNPAHVRAYRLIGYENRRLRDEEFKDDRKDAGDLGAGHSVTALYEIIPAGSNETVPGVDPLKYQRQTPTGHHGNEALTVKLRYKAPASDTSTGFAVTLADRVTPASANLRFALAVTEFGLLLRDSPHKAQAAFSRVIRQAESALGDDEDGRRAEFLYLAKQAQALKAQTTSAQRD